MINYPAIVHSSSHKQTLPYCQSFIKHLIEDFREKGLFQYVYTIIIENEYNIVHIKIKKMK